MSLMDLFNFTYEDQPNSSRIPNTSQSRSFSMPHFTTTTNNNNNNNFDFLSDISLTAPRRSTDIDRLYKAYLGGHVEGTHLLHVPDWHHEEKVNRCGSNNNESWCNHAKTETNRGFRLDPVNGKVSLKGNSCSSKSTERTDKATGLTTKFQTMTMSDESTFHQDMKTMNPKKKTTMKKKKKKSFWSSFFSFGCL